MNLDTPDLQGTGLHVTQFFATGAAARNLAKDDFIRKYFKRLAQRKVGLVDQAKLESARTILENDQADIKAYFDKDRDLKFVDRRNKLLKEPGLANLYSLMPSSLKNATDYNSFNTALQSRAEFIEPIAAAARRLTKSDTGASPSKS